MGFFISHRFQKINKFSGPPGKGPRRDEETGCVVQLLYPQRGIRLARSLGLRRDMDIDSFARDNPLRASASSEDVERLSVIGSPSRRAFLNTKYKDPSDPNLYTCEHGIIINKLVTETTGGKGPHWVERRLMYDDGKDELCVVLQKKTPPENRIPLAGIAYVQRGEEELPAQHSIMAEPLKTKSKNPASLYISAEKSSVRIRLPDEDAAEALAKEIRQLAAAASDAAAKKERQSIIEKLDAAESEAAAAPSTEQNPRIEASREAVETFQIGSPEDFATHSDTTGVTTPDEFDHDDRAASAATTNAIVDPGSPWIKFGGIVFFLYAFISSVALFQYRYFIFNHFKAHKVLRQVELTYALNSYFSMGSETWEYLRPYKRFYDYFESAVNCTYSEKQMDGWPWSGLMRKTMMECDTRLDRYSLNWTIPSGKSIYDVPEMIGNPNTKQHYCRLETIALWTSGEVDPISCGVNSYNEQGCTGGYYTPLLSNYQKGSTSNDVQSDGPGEACENGYFCPSNINCMIPCLPGTLCLRANFSDVRAQTTDDDLLDPATCKEPILGLGSEAQRMYASQLSLCNGVSDYDKVCPGAKMLYACPKGYYCPDATMAKKCKKLHYCPPGMTEGIRCLLPWSCSVEGLDYPDLVGTLWITVIIVAALTFSVSWCTSSFMTKLKERRRKRQQKRVEKVISVKKVQRAQAASQSELNQPAKLSDEQVRQGKEVFRDACTSFGKHVWELERDSFVDCIAHLLDEEVDEEEMEALFDEADADHSGTVDMNEFLALYAKACAKEKAQGSSRGGSPLKALFRAKKKRGGTKHFTIKFTNRHAKNLLEGDDPVHHDEDNFNRYYYGKDVRDHIINVVISTCGLGLFGVLIWSGSTQERELNASWTTVVAVFVLIVSIVSAIISINAIRALRWHFSSTGNLCEAMDNSAKLKELKRGARHARLHDDKKKAKVDMNWGIIERKEGEDDEEEEAAHFISRKTDTRVDLEMKDLGLRLKGSGRSVLDGVTGYLRAGRLTALMGPSGAGKTTLLNTLSGRATYGDTCGTLLING